MGFTKFTNSESLQVKTDTVQTFLKKAGKVNYDQLTTEEREELNEQLNKTESK